MTAGSPPCNGCGAIGTRLATRLGAREVRARGAGMDTRPDPGDVRAVATAYATAREYLDDLVAWVEPALERLRLEAAAEGEAAGAGLAPADAAHRRLAELELELGRREEVLAARRQATALAGPAGYELPLERVRRVFGLSDTEAAVLAALAVLELSPRARRAAGELLGGPDAGATVGLVDALVYRTARQRAASSAELVDDGRLFAYRLAELGGGNLPWLARPVRVARRVLELALGRLRLDLEVASTASLVEHPPSAAGLLLGPRARAVLADATAGGGGGPLSPVVMLAGPPGAGRGALALALAHARGRPALVVRAGGLPRTPDELVAALQRLEREALLFDAILVVRDLDALAGDEGRAQPDLVPAAAAALARHGGALVVTASRPLWPPANARPAVVVELGVPSEVERAELWRRALGPAHAQTAEEAAARYRITGGVIERAARSALGLAGVRGEPLALADVRAGIRQQLDAELATMGRRVEWRQTWGDLVLPPDLREELDELISRVRHRRRVLDEWGFGRKVAKGTGVSALFSGPPGTGKTMVAGLIAGELDLDLYMIDVSRMVSKWVGETEKNLARLFDAAAAGHAVLLFDEADSLFAKRTEVKSSNDRYANLEVGYLLQRMEAFEGITILTTNLESSIDEAFRRRLAFRIAFPLPDVEERAQLWRAMLPAEARVAPRLDFTALADRYAMSGGYIRNAVLRAAYLAAAAGEAIGMKHLERAAVLEYTAMGKIVHQGGGPSGGTGGRGGGGSTLY